MKKDNLLRVGKIVGLHGLDGKLKVYSFCESVDTLTKGGTIFVKTPGGRDETYRVNWAKPHKNIVLLSLKGVSTPETAEALVGSVLFIDRKFLPELEEDTYYWDELVGLDVVGLDGTLLGKLSAVMPTGSNDVYVVKDGKKETLVPAMVSVVKSVDLEKGVMTVELPEGLGD